MGLGELHDDPQSLARVQERLLPVRIGGVVPHDLEARGPGAATRLVEVRDFERHVMNARPAPAQEPVKEAAAP
jgi:hypothetical protein